MGKVMSMVASKVKRFNVESRAHRVLERDKPMPAPKFESNLKDMQRTLELDPTFVEKLNKKDTSLDTRLRDVYVTSSDKIVERKNDPNRPLPLDRAATGDYEFGYKEPERVSRGKCTLRQAIKFITDHQGDPDLWSKQKIAEQYKLNEKTVGDILFYFKSFNVFIPDKGLRESILTQSKAKMLTDKPDVQTKDKQDKDKESAA